MSGFFEDPQGHSLEQIRVGFARKVIDQSADQHRRDYDIRAQECTGIHVWPRDLHTVSHRLEFPAHAIDGRGTLMIDRDLRPRVRKNRDAEWTRCLAGDVGVWPVWGR